MVVLEEELALQIMWKLRLKMRVGGDKLWSVSGDMMQNNFGKPTAQTLSMRAEGTCLWATADVLWWEAVTEVYGDIEAEWKDGECHLKNGLVFKP